MHESTMGHIWVIQAIHGSCMGQPLDQPLVYSYMDRICLAAVNHAPFIGHASCRSYMGYVWVIHGLHGSTSRSPSPFLPSFRSFLNIVYPDKLSSPSAIFVLFLLLYIWDGAIVFAVFADLLVNSGFCFYCCWNFAWFKTKWFNELVLTLARPKVGFRSHLRFFTITL